MAWREIASSLRLSPRELEIVRATFDDRKELAIAADLGIAPRTVHTHIERLHRKLKVADRVQLVLRIMYEYLRLTSSAPGSLPPICPHAAAGCCPLRGPTDAATNSFSSDIGRQQLSASKCALSAQQPTSVGEPLA
jgi:DNA-binding CsgD family transcriptional regulator